MSVIFTIASLIKKPNTQYLNLFYSVGYIYLNMLYFLLKFLQIASNVNKNVDILIYVTVRGLSNFAIE